MDLMNNEKIKIYMDLVCTQIKFKDIHGNIKEELIDHMDGIVEENMEKGFSLEESIDIGIKHMGDPYILGKELNKVHKPKPEWSILALTLIFTLIGISTIYILSSSGLIPGWSTYGIMKNSILMAIAGVGTIVVLYFFDYRKIKPFSKYLYIATSLLIIMGNIGGTENIFVRLGIFRVAMGRVLVFSTDLNYITPFLYAMALSGIFSEERWQKNKIISNLIILFLPIILTVAFQLSVVTPIIMYFTMVLALIYVSGGSIKYILGSIGAGAFVVVLSIFSQPHRIERVKNLLNPLRDPLGCGYMNVQLRKLISSAGLLGNRMNIDKTEIPILDSPQMHTDFIFSSIIYAFGWLAGITIIVLSIVFFIRLIKTIKSVEDNYGRLLVATFSALFIIQFVYNILMILGVAPLAGISMPFISYGTTLNIVNMIMIGIISSVYRRKDIVNIDA